MIKNFDKNIEKTNANIFFNLNKNLNSAKRQNKTLSDFENILAKLRNRSDFKNIPLLNETLELRFQYILELAHREKFILKENISELQVKAIEYFIKEAPFVVLECDKKTGALILSKENEVMLAYKCLDDEKTYEKLTYDPLFSTSTEISNNISDLLSKKLISDRLSKLLINRNAKLGKFRVLPKIHKKNSFGVRPIINSMNSPTNKICLLVFLVLQPLVIQSESFLQDSQHLLQLLSNLNQIELKNKNKCVLYSCDFEALYTNIDLKLALTLIMELVIEFKALDEKHISSEGFKKLLELIFNHNVFTFENKFFKQVKGIAMGAICGPAIANVVVYKLERKWLHVHRPILYKRFIDDIFIIEDQIIDEVDFQKNFFDLKLNIVKGSNVQFLDLDISFDNFFNRIDTKLYIKPTNTFSYLCSESSHKKSIFKNIPKSIFIRARRICSNYIDYLKFSRIFYTQLLDRGYSAKNLSSLIRNIGNLDRNKLIEYKKREPCLSNEQEEKNNFWIVFDFLELNHNFNNIIFNSWNNLAVINEKINKLDVRLNIANKNMNNLKNIFVHGAKLSLKNFNNKCKPCKESLCTACYFFSEKSYFKLNNISIPVMNNCNCKSVNCIYIISCLFCDAFYIGETCRSLEERLYNHLYNIRKFIPIHKEFSEIAAHFNLFGHNYYHHLRISIFACNISDTFKRKQIESELIHIFLTMGLKVINKKVYSKISNFFTSI